MKQYHGLEHWLVQHNAHSERMSLATWLLDDLQTCHCDIYSHQGEDDQILLARLSVLQSSLEYEAFDQRIDFVVMGPILRNDCVPLTYRLQGKVFAISGRCSILGKICGVDLYLQSTYSNQVGDIARHKFAIPIKSLLQTLKSQRTATKLL